MDTTTTHQTLMREDKPDLAYHFTDGAADLPVVVFLGGYASDMDGTKATWLEGKAKDRGQAYLRLNYSGHGRSGGAFKDGTIGSWMHDAMDVIAHTCGGERPLILVGSSMGGWIGLLITLERPEQVRGLVGIAAAPDFTLEVEARLSAAQRQQMAELGYAEEPNEYSDEPYIFTRALIEDGRERLILEKRHQTSAKLIMLQGKQDADVPWEKAERICAAFDSPRTEVRFIDDGDHRLSRPQDLEMINQAIVDVMGA